MTGPAPTPRRTTIFLSHSGNGGAGHVMANLGEGLRADGSHVEIVALYPHPRSTLRPSLPLRYIVPVRPSSPLAAARMVVATLRWFRDERPERVFSALPAGNVMAAFAARLAGLRDRVVITHHSLAHTHNRFLNAIDTLTGRLASVRAIVTVSDAVGASLARKPASYRRKVRTIRNALPPALESTVAELAAARRHDPPSPRSVITVGRLSPEKNFEQLVRAAARLREISVTIVGAGPEEETLRAAITAHGVMETVTLAGYQPREAALATVARAGIFVQVSRFEGHSLALVEAAKLGLPLIVSDIAPQIEGITAEDGTRCGIAVPLDDDDALAAAIMRLADDPAEYALWAERARLLASTATFERMLAAYRRLEGDDGE